MMNKIQKAEQMHRALLMFCETLDDEKAMEVACMFDEWKPGKQYKGGDRFTYGVNAVGDPQLYRVNDGKEHISQADWLPDTEPSLYTAIGLDESGFAVWAQPTGAHDSYNFGDIVNHNGILYVSQINGNTYIPGTDDRWWKVYEGESND